MKRRDFLKAISITAVPLALGGCFGSNKPPFLTNNMGRVGINGKLNICEAPYFADPTGKKDCRQSYI